jgi:hypothetical protein
MRNPDALVALLVIVVVRVVVRVRVVDLIVGALTVRAKLYNAIVHQQIR